MLRKLVRFTTSKGRESFELHKDSSDAFHKKVKRLAILCAEKQRKGLVFTDKQKHEVQTLPSAVLDQFIAHGIWERIVPITENLRPYIDALVTAALPGQEFVFEKYRKCTNTRELIRKNMSACVAI